MASDLHPRQNVLDRGVGVRSIHHRFFSRLRQAASGMSIFWLVSYLSCHAQTSPVPTPVPHLFSIPAMRLREEMPAVASARRAEVSTNSINAEVSSHSRSPILEKYEAWLAQSWLETPRRSIAPGTFKARLFPEPEFIRWKHIAIGGSLVNVMKQGNPLCLLTPVVLAIDF